MNQLLAGLRPYRPEDIDRLVALLAAAKALPPGPPPAPEDVLTRWARRGVVPEESVNVLPSPSGDFEAYSMGVPFRDGSSGLSLDIAVHPDYRGRGIGSALLHLIEERAARLNLAHLAVQVHTAPWEERPESTGFLRARGFERFSGRWQYRIDNVTSAPLSMPPGITVRAMDDIERDAGRWAYLINVAFAEPASAASIASQVREPGSDPEGYFFAVDEVTGEEVGTSRARIDYQGGKPVGYIGTVGVLPSYRRRGIAEALVQYTLAYFLKRGIHSATLLVEEHNHPARALYEKLGWHPAFLSSNYWRYVRPTAY